MAPDDILTACIIALIFSPILALILWALYLLTQGVEGIGRRLYAMLLLLLSVLGAGVVFGVPMLLCAGVLGTGIIVVAGAAGIPVSLLFFIVMGVGRAIPQGGQPLDSWFAAYLAWIKRVAQGKR